MQIVSSAEEVAMLRNRESLDELLTRLIAEAYGVGKEVVTSDWILRKREEEIYPRMTFETSAMDGGYNGYSLRFLSGDEIHAVQAWGISLLRQFRKNENYPTA